VTRLPAVVGLLWLTALPARLLLVLLCVRLAALGAGAVGYGDYLRRLAYGLLFAWLLSLWGRQVFVRCCRHALRSERPPPRALLFVPAAELAGHFSAALLIEVAFWALLPTLVLPVGFVVLAGLAAAAAPRGGQGLLAPLREVAAAAGSLSVLARLLAATALALLLAAVNLHSLSSLGLWIASGLAGAEVAPWQAVLRLANPLYAALLLAGASLLVEPFWLAALTAQVERTRARGTGDDLKRWFSELEAKR
jgi:hypothetical protein